VRGLGSFTHALAESAKQAGAEIRTDAEVQHIRIKDGAVTGIVLADGEEIAVEAVVSSVDPNAPSSILSIRASRSDLRQPHEKFPCQWHRR